jgi:hypothetical protein
MPEKLEHRTLLDETMLADPDKWYRIYEELPKEERYGSERNNIHRNDYEGVSACISEKWQRKASILLGWDCLSLPIKSITSCQN